MSLNTTTLNSKNQLAIIAQPIIEILTELSDEYGVDTS
jgi:hypothetical protein